ncbi:MAG TPA: hypothetical protein VNR18_00375, partial [Hyphomicrobiales bacterium]|nr:hypothetical protein [Hyphomicrobiales bacterium]
TVESAPPAAPAPASYSEFNTTATIRDVMNTLIDPSADALWEAVRFEVDEDGEHDFSPQTEEEWQALRYEAVSIIEGGNALMLPDRHVAPPGATTEFPEYEFIPEEVEAKLREDRQSWIGFAQGLQNAAVQALQAIEDRNVDQLIEYGALLDEACESCHSQYWYRPEVD